MEFQIRNSYIKKFLGGFSNQNELKIIKYLTILGINSLENSKNSNISFSELKKMAKNITKSCEKEDKVINKELNIIKKELVKLSKRFEEKLKDTPPKTELVTPKASDENPARSSSVPKESNSKHQNLALKPPSRWNETKYGKSEINIAPEPNKRRSNSIDTSNPHLKNSKLSDYITPKPTEITFPIVDPRENRNYITRHHLDDSQAKSIFLEQAKISQNEINEPRGRVKTQNQKSNGKSLSLTKTRDEKENVEPEINRDKKSSTAGRIIDPKVSFFEDVSRSRSPKFAFPKEETFAKLENSSVNYVKFEREDERKTNPYFNQKSSRTEVTPKQSSQSNANLFPKKVPQKMATERFGNFGRHSNRSQLNQTHNERKSANDYHNVESKIRDEVKYHKELSKQYKKMKQSIQEYTDNVNEKFSNASSSQRREKDKFVLVEKDDPKAVSRLYQFGPSSYRPSGLFDSTSSPQKSLYLKASSSQYSNKSPSYGASSARYNKESQENLSQSKNSGGRNGGGMLDIANSFLNSPFMQHLSNLDAKSSRISPDSSINKKIDRSDYIDLIKNNKNLKTSFEERRSPKKSNYTSYKMEDARAGDITQNYSKYSNWVGNYKHEKGNSSSILKESDNKRYNEYVGSLQQSKNDSNSLASSNFSNFLSDEMKGFFQKENLELKRPKSIMRESMDYSPSHKPQDISYNKKREISISDVKQNNYITPPSGNNQTQANKSNIGESIDNGNVFKHERMSVTHLLNT